MFETGKINSAAANPANFAVIPPDAQFIDGESFHPSRGGVVLIPDGTVLSVAAPGNVPGGHAGDLTPMGEGTAIAGNRVAEMHIRTDPVPDEEVGHGFEKEIPVIDQTGEVVQITRPGPHGSAEFVGALATLGSAYAKVTPETHNYVAELGTTPAFSVREFVYNTIRGTYDVVQAITADGNLPLPMDVVGYRRMGPEHMSSDRYLGFITGHLALLGELPENLPLASLYVAYASQAHQGIKQLDAALKAASDMQLANVILSGSGVNGPFFLGRHAHDRPPDFGQEQWDILAGRGVFPADFIGGRLSWRGLIRRLVSPSAGPWHEAPPTEALEYLRFVNQGLRDGLAASGDRVTAEHGDRIRTTIPDSGTFESLSHANGPSLLGEVAAAAVWNGVFAGAEEMHMRGMNPRDHAPLLFGSSLKRARLERMSTDRCGLDALRDGKPMFTAFDEVRYMADFSGKGEIPETLMSLHSLAYVSGQETRAAIRSWRARTGRAPGMRAFHEMHIGVPAWYVLAREAYLREQKPELTPEQRILDCQLDVAHAYVDEVERTHDLLMKGQLV